MIFLYGDCKRNHTVKKYNSYAVYFWQKSLVYQEGISRIILWKCLFSANCIVRNQHNKGRMLRMDLMGRWWDGGGKDER